MLKHKAKNRWQAFAVHLVISLLLFVSMCAIIVIFWYPGLLFTTEGGWQGVRLIAGIDFVIGPTLTLIVYKVGKTSLRFDLACIGLLQATCICYGMYVVHSGRPAAVVYGDGIYYAVPLIRYEGHNLDTSQIPLLQQQRWPAWIALKLPADNPERQQLKIRRLGTLDTSIDLYESYDSILPMLPSEGLSLEQARERYGITTDLDSHAIRAYRLETRYGIYLVAVNLNSGRFVSILKVIQRTNPAT